MIRITYALGDKALAERIRDDLAGGEADAPLLIALNSRASSADPAVQSEIAKARQSGGGILAILTDDAPLPPNLEYEKPLDFSKGYQRDRLLARTQQLTMTRAQQKSANRRALIFIGALALLMFGLALAGITRGLVAFPVAEYNEEATFQSMWIDGLIRETLEAAMPRTTPEAVQFAATLEAAPTRLYYYIRGSATALARSGAD